MKILRKILLIMSFLFVILSNTSCVAKVFEKAVTEIKAGKDKLKGWFVGQIMKASQGKVNPGLANQLLDKKLGEI